LYGGFSRLIQSTLDKAQHYFAPGTIDVLHIAGSSSYAVAKHDFEHWLPQMSPRGIMVFHDIATPETKAGVWQLWGELARRYPSFEFSHGHGLGILALDHHQPEPLRHLLLCSREQAAVVRAFFAELGSGLKMQTRMANASGGIAQVFIPTAEGYPTEATYQLHVKPGQWTRLVYTARLAACEKTRSLRFDPLDRVGMIEIAELTLRSAIDGQMLWQANTPEAFATIAVQGTAMRLPHMSGLQIFSYGTDPQVYLPPVSDLQETEAINLEVWMRAEPHLWTVAGQYTALQARLAEAHEALTERDSRIASLEEIIAKRDGQLAGPQGSIPRHGIAPRRRVAWLKHTLPGRAMKPVYWLATRQLSYRLRLRRQMRWLLGSGLFDESFYLHSYRDVAVAGMSAALHFLVIGAAEGRDPYPLFDTSFYLAQYPDVVAEGINPLRHYVEFGAAEGCDPHPLFDTSFYLARYPDVVAEGINPLRHYVEFGAAEGRDPHPLFDTSFYLARYPDVVAEGINPLRHYVEFGAAEGRYPTSVAEADQVYLQWVHEYDTLHDADRTAIHAHIEALARRPVISIVVPVYNTGETYLREMIESVFQQLYPHWELCLADDASTEPHVERVLREFAALDTRVKIVRRQINGHICAATNSALDLATGEFVALLDHDDLLSERALYEVALELDAHPDADIIYSDSDNIDDSGRRWAPYFKTDWDPDLMLGHNMISHLGVYRRALVERIGRLRVGFEGSQDYDLMLRAAEATTPDRIRHIPAVLYHWRRDARSSSFSALSHERCLIAARRAIRSHLERTGARARVEVAPRIPSFTRVVYTVPSERPLVSVIVPTRDKADLLACCAAGVLTCTDYEPLELIIVDNESQEPETHQLLAHLAADPRVRILRHPGDFNCAAINNRAVQEARGDLIVLLNNDVNVISSWWLEEMASHALRTDVGAVGAKLLYPDGRVQHAGVVLGVGHGAGHFFHRVPKDDIGYMGFLALTRRVSAVTAACMVLRRSVYLEVGGLDEDNFPVAFNDVDLCLRLGARGYAIVWTPHAELYHCESATRGADMGAERATRLAREAECLWRRWGAVLRCDPYYNPNCSLVAGCFEPGFPPRRPKPWLLFKDRTTMPPPGRSRAETLLAPLDRSARIIEIGPSYNPIAPKADGWNTCTIDHTTRANLVEKYRNHPVEVDRIEDVDCIWTSGSVADAVPSDLHGTFDAFIASHVIEHTTDLVGFLDAAATLLAPSGIVILAIPDKRYCFDYFRPLTTTGEVLAAHMASRNRHTRRIVFDHMAYAVMNGGACAWGQTPIQTIQFYHPIEEAYKAFSTVREDPDAPYVDMHAWQFTPASFDLLLLELARLGETDWLVEQITPAIGCEFYVWLRRGGRTAAAALTPEELDRRRLALLEHLLLQAQEQGRVPGGCG
jgi:glycosyltransferase involved in cell wall biosynthesis